MTELKSGSRQELLSCGNRAVSANKVKLCVYNMSLFVYASSLIFDIATGESTPQVTFIIPILKSSPMLAYGFEYSMNK